MILDSDVCVMAFLTRVVTRSLVVLWDLGRLLRPSSIRFLVVLKDTQAPQSLIVPWDYHISLSIVVGQIEGILFGHLQ